MQLHRGDMFSQSTASVVLATTNAMVNAKGNLVMGRGAAYQMTQKYPGIERHLGTAVTEHHCTRGHWLPYGVIITAAHTSGKLLGAFQVKYTWSDKADQHLIAMSAGLLGHYARTDRDVLYAVNFPGIGNGGLDRSAVLPLIDFLPDNVEVWEL